jgi:hypothetical protein
MCITFDRNGMFRTMITATPALILTYCTFIFLHIFSCIIGRPLAVRYIDLGEPKHHGENPTQDRLKMIEGRALVRTMVVPSGT